MFVCLDTASTVEWFLREFCLSANDFYEWGPTDAPSAPKYPVFLEIGLKDFFVESFMLESFLLLKNELL